MFIFMLDLGGIMGFGAWHPLTSLRSLMRASIYRKGKNTKNRARNGPAGAPGAAPMPGLKTFTPSGETPSGSHGGASPSPIPPPHTSPFWWPVFAPLAVAHGHGSPSRTPQRGTPDPAGLRRPARALRSLRSRNPRSFDGEL